MQDIYKIRTTKKQRIRRKLKARATYSQRLRLSVFRSHQHIWAQIINDEEGHTLVSASSKELLKADPSLNKLTKTELATRVGSALAKKALSNKIKQVYLDRGHYKYHGRVKALAEAARRGGLEF